MFLQFHIINTFLPFVLGQGVVLVRSPYSDRVFAEAERKMGWLTRKCMLTIL